MLFNTTPIQMEWFFHLEGEKTKLNWYLMEIAMEHYDRIRDSEALAHYREQYDEKQIAQFCAYYARRLKPALLNYLRGRRKTVIFHHEHVGDFYPHHGLNLNRALNRVARDAFDHMWYACKGCPQQCLNDYEATSPLFDRYKDGGGPR
jgi:hypothetical protein